MLQNTRALRRASSVAEARNAVTARRPKWIFGTIAGGVIGAALTVGIVSAPAAAGAETPDPVADVATFVTGGAAPLTKKVDDAAIHISIAQDAADAAEAVTAEVAASGLDLAGAPAAVDTTDLDSWIDRLGDRDGLSSRELTSLEAYVAAETEAVATETATLQNDYAAAQQRKVEEEQAAAAAAALAQANTPDGAKATAREMMASQYGWGDDQFSCLNSLWTKESGWNYKAYNKSGGATGIPQALPGSKMASAGADWQDNAATQIAWGLGYIKSVYGTPCSAWGHSQASNWY